MPGQDTDRRLDTNATMEPLPPEVKGRDEGDDDREGRS
jgi:hypothetical protein